jgi:UDP-N-acetylmuramoyl-tripeptide--D-alanyl-D-alanine ligase
MKKILQNFLRIFAKAIIKKYDPDVIGITGSVGKTSTKEAVKMVLKDNYNIRASAKNYNNELGVPLTIIGAEKSPGKSVFGWIYVFLSAINLIILRDSDYPEILILEMGADKEGDIGYLVDIAPCKIGILTNISESHLEFFGTVAKVKKEKKKIIEHLRSDGYALINCDIDGVCDMKGDTKANVLTYGFDKTTDISVSDAVISYNENGGVSGINFKLIHNGNVVPVFMPKALGFAHIYSALAAVGVGSIYGLNLVDIAKNLSSFESPKGRMKLIEGIKNTYIIDDTYNSSPASSKAALEVMQEINLRDRAKKFVVLGDMLELGKFSVEKHKEIGLRVVESEIDVLITKGEGAKDIADGAIEAGMDQDKVFSFSDNESAGRFLQGRLKEGDLVLVKGSQGMRMEEIVKEIMAKPMQAKGLLVRQGMEWG